MEQVRVIEIKESVFADNDREAARIRGELKENKTFLMNLMSSPGSGKTTTLLRTIEKLKDEVRIGVMEADIDLAILENVGNLVCPAEFDTGAVKNVMILSVPEGHDKPLKYPLIFTVCDALIINRIDVLPYFDFDMDKVTEYAPMRNPKLKIFPISAKTGEGVDAWCDWLKEQVTDWIS